GSGLPVFRGARLDGAGAREATILVAAAAVAGQEPDKPGHRVEIGAIADVPALRLALDQARRGELLEVERQGGAGQRQHFGDLSWCAPFMACLDQQAED